MACCAANVDADAEVIVASKSIKFFNITIDPTGGKLENERFDKCDPYVPYVCFYIDDPGWGGEKAQTSCKERLPA